MDLSNFLYEIVKRSVVTLLVSRSTLNFDFKVENQHGQEGD